MTLLLPIAFLMGLAASVTTADAGSFSHGNGHPLSAFPFSHHFHARRHAQRTSDVPFITTYGIGELSDSGYLPGSSAPAVPRIFGPDPPPVVDLPPCREVGPGNVMIVRGSSCAHGPEP